VDELARKCKEGRLTPQVRAEYESYVSAASVITIRQAGAGLRLARPAAF
jgi:hypothetical protein